MSDKLLVPFIHEGVWWKPELPEEQIAGTLSYDPVEGSILSLLGHFSGQSITGDPLSGNIPVIHGVTKDTGEVTLYYNWPTSFTIKVPGIPTQDFHSRFVCMGEHMGSPETFTTSHCEFRLTNIEEWLDHRPFNFQFSNSEPRTFNLDVDFVDKQLFAIPHINASIRTDVSYQTHGGRVREFSIDVLSWLILELDQPGTLEKHLEIISRIRNFVALCLGERVYISNLVFRGKEENNGQGVSRKRKIECYFQQNPSPIEKGNKNYLLGLTLNDFGDKKEKILNNWLVLYDTITPSLDILFTTLYTDIYLGLKFLLAAQSIETLHRHLNSSTYVDENVYLEIEKTLVDNIPPEVPPTLKTKLKDMLKYGNEFSLRRRLKEISLGLSEKGAGHIVSIDRTFINDVVNTRNYLTHYDKSLQASAKTGKQLYELYAKLSLMVMVVVFSELGASMEMVEGKLRQHRLFGSYVGK